MKKALLLFVFFIVIAGCGVLFLVVYQFFNTSSSYNNRNILLPHLKVLIAHFNEGYAPGIKNLLESKGIETKTLPIATLSPSIIEPYDLIIITGSERNRGEVDNVKEFNKPVLGYGVYGCTYFGKLKLKNGWPYT